MPDQMHNTCPDHRRPFLPYASGGQGDSGRHDRRTDRADRVTM